MDALPDLDTPPLDPPAVDAVLLVSFGGPEGPEDVVPFLENVTRGRGIPPERLAEVGRHYLEHFGGVSPINDQCRALQAALRDVVELPVYWGNRNWHPFLADTLQEMRGDGIRHALAVVTSAFPSYSGCRQYREDLVRARVEVGEGAPLVTKVRHYYAEDGFLDPMARAVQAAAEGLTASRLVFTAHSIPVASAASSGPSGGAYVETLRLASGEIARRVGHDDWDLVFQSRSGPPQVPWLEPDIGDHLADLHAQGVREVVVVPVGFTSDHVEVVYDLDIQARAQADALPGLVMRRASTVGTDPQFVAMLGDLVRERLRGPELATHGAPATHDRCPATCCPAPRRPAA